MVSLTLRFARLLQFDPTFRRPLTMPVAPTKIRDTGATNRTADADEV
jgi:hypothetical protein